MTLRENLLEDFDNLVGEYRASRQETRRTLNKYAIGKWVPVSERLPTECFIGNAIHSVYGKGYVVLMKTDSRFGTFYKPGMVTSFHTATDITHWLELDMPEVGE
jgi:hypothetical protein